MRASLVPDIFDKIFIGTSIFDGAAEAKLTGLACSEPPKGRASGYDHQENT
jgi:hypothetical protein